MRALTESNVAEEAEAMIRNADCPEQAKNVIRKLLLLCRHNAQALERIEEFINVRPAFHYDNAFLDKRVEENFILSVRASSILKRHDVIAIGDILRLGKIGLKKLPDCGNITIAEIERELKGVGIELSEYGDKYVRRTLDVTMII